MSVQLYLKGLFVNSSFELFVALKNENLLSETEDLNWWPNSGSFEVIVGAILTQQTKWAKVEKSLENLRVHNLLHLEKIADIDTKILADLIKSSGFYNTKAKRLKMLCQKIVETYGSFDNFKKLATREWLLSQKGVGQESADAILCYACGREVLVVDNYTNKLLRSLGYEFETYDELQEWMMRGIEENLECIYKLYEEEINLYTIYTRFHGKIVELGKSKKNIREILLC